MKTVKQAYKEALNKMDQGKAYGNMISAPGFVCDCRFTTGWRITRTEKAEKHRRKCKKPWKLESKGEIIVEGKA